MDKELVVDIGVLSTEEVAPKNFHSSFPCRSFLDDSPEVGDLQVAGHTLSFLLKLAMNRQNIRSCDFDRVRLNCGEDSFVLHTKGI